MKKTDLFKHALLAASCCLVATACSDDTTDGGSGTPGDTAPQPAAVSFIVASGDPTTDLTGGIQMKVYTDLTATRENEAIYGTADAVKSADGFTQEVYNPNTGVYTGFIYARAAASTENGGIGASKAGYRSYTAAGGTLTPTGTAYGYLSNFGNTGYFGEYTYAAQISNPVVAVIDRNGASREVTIDPNQYAIEGVNPAVSNIVDLGQNQVAMILTYSNRDSAVVAFADYNLNISKVIYTDRIGTSVGATRSVRYTQSATDDAGNLYVFCGSSATDGRVGALRVNKGTTEFDANYKFDILTAASGYRFRKVFHITDDKFLIEFFNTKTEYANMSESGQMAIADMGDKTLTWVSGIETDPSKVSVTWGDAYGGYYYLPVAAATSMSGGSQGGGGGRPQGVASRAEAADVTPTIYRIDPATGIATPFMTFAKSDLLKGIRIMK